MKRSIVVFMICLFVLCAASVALAAEARTSGLFTYEIKGNGTAVITYYDWKKHENGDLYIPNIENDENGAIDVNGGQYEEGGATLFPDPDTNGYLQTDFEYTAIAERGTAVIPLADQVILNVFQMDDDFNVAEEGYDTETVSAGEVRAALARTCELMGDDFYPYQTTIRIENGAAVEITVDYMP